MEPDKTQDEEQPGRPLEDEEVDQVAGGLFAPPKYSAPIVGGGTPLDTC